MDDKDRKHIRNNYTKLGEAITEDVLNLIDRLYEQGTISKRNKEDIIEINVTNYRKGLKLLDLISTKGKTAYQELYNAVNGLEIFVAADILMPANAPHSKQVVADEYESPEETLPDSWPTDEKFDISTIFRIVEPKHTKMTALFNKTKTLQGREFTYLMSSKNRGRVLTINNELFTSLPERKGTIEDRKAIDTVFQKLNFDVCTFKNKTHQQMWEVLVEESKSEKHLQANCFVLFLLSHGHNGVVFGTDGKMEKDKPVNCIEIKKVVDLFCETNSLRGKPKLLFIQACQGEANNAGDPKGSFASISDVPLEEDMAPSKEKSTVDNNVDKSDNTYNHNHQTLAKTINDDAKPNAQSDETLAKTINDDAKPNAQSDETLVQTTVGDGVSKINQPDHANIEAILNNILPTTQSDADGDKSPSGADCLVAMATLPGHLSWRNTVKGSWFVQAIAYVFAKYAYKHDLAKLMTRVSNLVSRAETSEGIKQQGITQSTLSKDLYFFPGLTESE